MVDLHFNMFISKNITRQRLNFQGSAVHLLISPRYVQVMQAIHAIFFTGEILIKSVPISVIPIYC